MDASGETPLPGGNTLANTNATEGALVQIFQVGPDGVADWPGSDGHPTGDDILLYEIPVGSGISPTNDISGLFALSLTNLPPANAILYARAYDAPSIDEANYWGQSVPFPVTGLAAMDVSELGLTGTTLPIGTTLFDVDSDNDGQSDFEEWLAGTHATDPSDWFRVIEELKAGIGGALAEGRLKVEGVAGRTYILERCTSLGPDCTWVVATNSGPLSEARTLFLTDPNPPASETLFYRVRVEAP